MILWYSENSGSTLGLMWQRKRISCDQCDLKEGINCNRLNSVWFWVKNFLRR